GQRAEGVPSRLRVAVLAAQNATQAFRQAGCLSVAQVYDVQVSALCFGAVYAFDKIARDVQLSRRRGAQQNGVAARVGDYRGLHSRSTAGTVAQQLAGQGGNV